MNTPQNTKYLFLDMNSFFASCEQEANSNLRHKPVAVTPVDTPNGCIVAASYEAKAYGVKTGTSVKDARFICPQITICESNVPLYLDFHEKLVKILKNISPFLAIKSVDEAVIKLSTSERNSESAIKIARYIKEEIRQKMGKTLRASVGIGPNVWISKMAAESEKPDGLVELKLQQLPDFYQSLKLTDLKGINQRLKIRLEYLEIYKPLDLFLSSTETLRKKMGIAGEYWHLRMHGFDIDILESALPKSVGQSHVLEPKFRQWEKAKFVCQKLVERAGRRLREQKMEASGVSLYVKFLPHGFWHKALKTSPFSDSQTFYKHIEKLWSEMPEEGVPLKIGVQLYGLSKPFGHQQKIFPKMEKVESLYNAIDKINDRYGTFTIKPVNLMLAENSAPNRIAFGRPTK